MRIELRPDDLNVYRFPIERRVRPSLQLLLEIAPDPREIDLIVASFELDPVGPGIQDQAGQEIARHIAHHFPADCHEKLRALVKLREGLLREAVAICADAAHAAELAGEAARKLHAVKMGGGSYLPPLEERSSGCTLAGALAMVEAHIAVERTLGALRAIELVGKGEEWTAFDVSNEMDELMRLHHVAG